MSDVTIWHNPRCSKSRAALALIEEAGSKPNVVLYLEKPPTRAELEDVLRLLGVGARSLLRTGEPVYKELGLADAAKSEAELIVAMAEHPILIERPVVIRGKRAVIGRPPELVQELL